MGTKDDLHSELEEAVRDLTALENEMSADTSIPSALREKLGGIARRLKDALTVPVKVVAPISGEGGQPKYPAVRIALADLGGDLYAILRRASYAMSDADIGEEIIEAYKAEMTSTSDPVGVTKAWVAVTDA